MFHLVIRGGTQRHRVVDRLVLRPFRHPWLQDLRNALRTRRNMNQSLTTHAQKAKPGPTRIAATHSCHQRQTSATTKFSTPPNAHSRAFPRCKIARTICGGLFWHRGVSALFHGVSGGSRSHGWRSGPEVKTARDTRSRAVVPVKEGRHASVPEEATTTRYARSLRSRNTQEHHFPECHRSSPTRCHIRSRSGPL